MNNQQTVFYVAGSDGDLLGYAAHDGYLTQEPDFFEPPFPLEEEENIAASRVVRVNRSEPFKRFMLIAGPLYAVFFVCVSIANGNVTELATGGILLFLIITAAAWVMSDVDGTSKKKALAEVKGGTDPQAEGLMLQIAEATQYSRAGWGDDLWQAFFAFGKLIEYKKPLKNASIAREVYHEIQRTRDEIERMIMLRESAVEERLKMGIEPYVPGNESERIEAGVQGEMEELSMRPFLREIIEEGQKRNNENAGDFST